MPARASPSSQCVQSRCSVGDPDDTMLPSSPPIIHYHRHNLRHRFELIKTLGEGTYGKVKLAVEVATGEKVAIKYIRKKKIEDDLDLNRIRREIQVMAKLRHPHIINVREVFENKEKIVLVMDYASGGELYDYINSKKRLDDRDARRIFRQIVSAVHYCHQNNVVHRDLKLENIVLDDNGNVRIADFGLSNFYGGNVLLMTFCGSPLYASPEIVNGIPYKGPEVDCWSLGVLLYTLVHGAMPFDGADFKTLKKQISAGDYYEPPKPSEADSLISQLLNPSLEKRATIEKVLNHWWMNIGFSTTPSGAPYTGPCMQALRPPFSFINFLSNGNMESQVYSYGAKYSRSAGGSVGRRFRLRPDDRESSEDLNHNISAKEDVSSGKGEGEGAYTKMGAGSDGADSGSCSDTLSNQSTEEAKMFDLGKKPARSILKKRGKFSGSDSGCGLEEVLATSSGHTSPVNGATSPVNGATSSGHSSPVNENLSSDLSYDLCDIETVLDKAVPEMENGMDSINGNTVLQQLHHSHGERDARNTCSQYNDQRSNWNKDSYTVSLGNVLPAGDLHSRTSPPRSIVTKSVPVRRGILKRPKRHNPSCNKSEEEKKRNSTGSSQGSNSSGNLLDFSYDSTEGEQLMSKFYLSRKNIKLRTVNTTVDSDMSACRTRLRALSVSDEDFFCKKGFPCEEAMFDMDEARDICRQAIEICSGKGF